MKNIDERKINIMDDEYSLGYSAVVGAAVSPFLLDGIFSACLFMAKHLRLNTDHSRIAQKIFNIQPVQYTPTVKTY